MIEKSFIVFAKGRADFRLRSITERDIENLRVWKNRNKAFFFLKQDITYPQQQKWFQAFTSRDDDFMFVVEQLVDKEWKEIGCMGFRTLEDEGCIDAYNIMRAVKIEPSSFTMSEAFATLLKFAENRYDDLPIRCKVLIGNPAVRWYEKNDFSIIGGTNDYCLMELNKQSLKNIQLVIQN